MLQRMAGTDAAEDSADEASICLAKVLSRKKSDLPYIDTSSDIGTIKREILVQEKKGIESFLQIRKNQSCPVSVFHKIRDLDHKA